MNTRTFVDDLLRALADVGLFDAVSVQNEGPIVDGYAYLKDAEACFLRFYFNESTGTTAFALIENGGRIWGIDFDNRRGWHYHPMNDVHRHESIAPLSVGEIIEQLGRDWANRGR